eukprot:m.129738 g.129738  ORF g.129738 m.129738 type:complete len:279 (-) comp16415_c0_seq2:189-1025(-)
MWDCHAHITDAQFDADRVAVLQRAKAAGVDVVVVVSEGLADARRAVDLVAELNGQQQRLQLQEKEGEDEAVAALPRLELCLGMHPCSVNPAEIEPLTALIREQALQQAIVGIGEVGLDYRPATLAADAEAVVKQRQYDILAAQARLAVELDLPLNVHSCNAGHYTIDLLRQCNASRVVFHAFDGQPKYAEQAVRDGAFFSIPPSFALSPAKEKFITRIPLDNLLLESDAPALGPVRGERNEPANAAAVSCREIARIKGLSIEEVAAATTRNAQRLFRR